MQGIAAALTYSSRWENPHLFHLPLCPKMKGSSDSRGWRTFQWSLRYLLLVFTWSIDKGQGFRPAAPAQIKNIETHWVWLRPWLSSLWLTFSINLREMLPQQKIWLWDDSLSSFILLQDCEENHPLGYLHRPTSIVSSGAQWKMPLAK